MCPFTIQKNPEKTEANINAPSFPFLRNNYRRKSFLFMSNVPLCTFFILCASSPQKTGRESLCCFIGFRLVLMKFSLGLESFGGLWEKRQDKYCCPDAAVFSKRKMLVPFVHVTENLGNCLCFWRAIEETLGRQKWPEIAVFAGVCVVCYLQGSCSPLTCSEAKVVCHTVFIILLVPDNFSVGSKILVYTSLTAVLVFFSTQHISRDVACSKYSTTYSTTDMTFDGICPHEYILIVALLKKVIFKREHSFKGKIQFLSCSTLFLSLEKLKG